MFNRQDFTLTDKEYELIKNWSRAHRCKAKYQTISIIFTPRDTGMTIVAKCNCGKRLEINS